MSRLLSVAAIAADIAVFSASGAPRVETVQPPSGNRFLVDPCWSSPTTLVTLNEGPPSLLQRRVGVGAPVTVRRLPRLVDASLAPGCDTVGFLRNGRRGLDVYLQTGAAPARRVLRTRTYWESRPRFAWTPDARRVAVAPREFDARLRVLDVPSGRVVRGFSLRRYGGLDRLGPQALTADGRLVVYGESGTTPRVRVADVDTGKVRVLARDATNPSVARRGDRVAVVAHGGVQILDLAGRVLMTVPGVVGEHLSWSPDDTRIAVTGWSDETSVDVIDLTATPPRVERRLPPSRFFSSAAVWSTDGAQLAIERDPF